MAINPQDKILVIVESPNKVKTISGILKQAGYKNCSVSASVGHIMELQNGGPCYNSGIYPAENFKMNLAVSEDKHKVVDELKAKVKASDKVFLMTDGDREGAVIAWSLIKFCKIPKSKCYRAITHEITPKAVIHAIENPIKFDDALVNAGLSRMMIDKLIGFGLSPLGKKYIGAKSIGRCQSVGLKLVSDRENEIQNFVPEMYFNLNLLFEKNKTSFKAKYIGYKTEKIERFTNKADVDAVIKHCEKGTYIIESINPVTKQEAPKPPFCTATFQQEAAAKLGLRVKDAMSCAQKLFEGINFGTEHVGLITYMRTDSTEFAPEFVPDLEKYIKNTYGNTAYAGARKSKKKETDQDGHECLRVTNVEITPEVLKNYITNDLLIKVYTLIWQRTVAAAMENAQIAETTYVINNKDHKFGLTFRQLAKAGYREVYNYTEDSEDLIKEVFNQGEELQKTKLDSTQKFTQPKPRYTEASLVKELQQREIGRPSTYATIVETILSPTRGYAELDNKQIVPTDRGMQLAEYCNRSFPKLINLNYTKEMEQKLDEVATGRLDWLTYMNEFYSNLDSTIKATSEIGLTSNEANISCPKCGKSMVMRRSRFGKLFYGCSQYPKCNGIVNVN